MSSEVATWAMIRTKISSFPVPTSGHENECLTKSEILAKGGENVRVEGSYGNGECVMLDNILANVIIWEYTFSVTPTSLSFDATGGTQQVSVTSYKRKYLNGNYTGEQVSVGFSSSASGIGFSSAGTSVSANENTIATIRSGSAKFTQNEGGKAESISLSQNAANLLVVGNYTGTIITAYENYPAFGFSISKAGNEYCFSSRERFYIADSEGEVYDCNGLIFFFNHTVNKVDSISYSSIGDIDGGPTTIIGSLIANGRFTFICQFTNTWKEDATILISIVGVRN